MMIHECEGSIAGEAVAPHLRGVIVERCFQSDVRPHQLQIVYHDPENREYDELYEDVERCPFCGYRIK